MRKLITILICISTLAFLSCGDNPGGGTNSNGNDDGNNNGNNGSSKTVTAANLNEFFDVLFQEYAVRLTCSQIFNTIDSAQTRCEGIRSGYFTTTFQTESLTPFRQHARQRHFNFSVLGRLYLDGTLEYVQEIDGTNITITYNGHRNFSGEFIGRIEYRNLKFRGVPPNRTLLGGNVTVNSLDATNLYFQRLLNVNFNE